MGEERPLLDARASDPAKMGWMQGFPPPPDKRISAGDAGHMRFPTHRYAFSHMREFLPTARVSRGAVATWDLPEAPRADLDAVRFTPLGGGQELSWEDALAANYTDAIPVLHRGAI